MLLFAGILGAAIGFGFIVGSHDAIQMVFGSLLVVVSGIAIGQHIFQTQLTHDLQSEGFNVVSVDSFVFYDRNLVTINVGGVTYDCNASIQKHKYFIAKADDCKQVTNVPEGISPTDLKGK